MVKIKLFLITKYGPLPIDGLPPELFSRECKRSSRDAAVIEISRLFLTYLMDCEFAEICKIGHTETSHFTDFRIIQAVCLLVPVLKIVNHTLAL